MTSRGLCEQKCEKRALRSSRAFGRKRAVSGCVKVVVGWILVTHDGNGGRRSCDHRHGVSVKNGVKRGSEAECYLKSVRTVMLRSCFVCPPLTVMIFNQGGWKEFEKCFPTVYCSPSNSKGLSHSTTWKLTTPSDQPPHGPIVAAPQAPRSPPAHFLQPRAGHWMGCGPTRTS